MCELLQCTFLSRKIYKKFKFIRIFIIYKHPIFDIRLKTNTQRLLSYISKINTLPLSIQQ